MMKMCKKVLALLLALILVFQSVPVTVMGTVEQNGSAEKKMYVFDLETFIVTLPTSKVRYDYLKLATALQGLANRETPQLYYYFMDGDEAKNAGWDIDEYWLGQLRQSDAYLSDYTLVTVNDYWELLTIFADCYEGIVLWDEAVPATANVASTIAGVENLLPVRYATGESDLYTVMLAHGFSESDVKKNLVGMFTGEGTIPGSNTPSTGSAKNDAYIWAKEQYLDTGLTNPLLMTYSLDGSSWVFEDDGGGARNAKFISVALPSQMEPGEVVKIKITVENTGTDTWTRNSYFRLGLPTVGVFGLYTNAEGTAYLTSNKDRLALAKDVAPGEQYTFAAYLKAPETEGAYELGVGMILDGVEWFGKKYYHGITVATSEENEEEENETVTVVLPENDADIMMVGHLENDTMTICVKNTGSETWVISADEDNGYFLRYTYGDTTKYAAPAIENASGSNCTFILALSDLADGETVTVQMVHRENGVDVAFGDSYTTQQVAVLADYDAQILNVLYPERIEPGEKAEVIVDVINLGSVSWTNSRGYKLGTSNRQFSARGTADDSGRLLDRIQIETEIEVKTGDVYRFHFDLHSWILATAGGTPTACIGTMDVKLQMVNDSLGRWIGTATTIAPYFGYEETAIIGVSNVNSTGTLGAEFISCELPESMEPGEVVPFKFTVKNIGTDTWAKDSYYRLALKTANGFGFYTNSEGTAYVTGNKDRLYVKTATASGDTVTIFGYLKAPDVEGTYSISVDMILDGKAWFGATYSPTIIVAEETEFNEETPANDSMILTTLHDGDNAIKVWVTNNGTATWTVPESESSGYFLRYTIGETSYYAAGHREAAGGVKARFDVTALPDAGSEDIEVVLQMVYRENGVDRSFGDSYTYVIEKQEAGLWEMEFVSVNIPETVLEGETGEAVVIVRNTGTAIWAESVNGVRLTLDKRVSSYIGISDDDGKLGNRVKLEPGITVATGDVYLFHFDLHSRQSAEDGTSTDLAGDVSVRLQMLKERSTADSAYAWFAQTQNISYSVTVPIRVFTDEVEVSCEEVNATSGFNATFVSAAVPSEMDPGEIVMIQFTMKNTGAVNIYCNPNLSTGQKVAADGSTDSDFSLYTTYSAGALSSTDSGSANRLKVKTSTVPGETYTFTCYIKAPTTAGTYTLGLRMVDDGGVGYFGSTYSHTITVISSEDDGLVEVPVAEGGVVYDNLFNTALPNADYYIANKAFFWDLSPDATIAPIDDRTQPVGSDVATLQEILLSQALQADAAAKEGNGSGIYTVGGFVPWTVKYTNYCDARSSMEPVTAEWTMVEIISTYHGQTDADAFGTVGLSNASVFSHVPLSENLTQNNDKGEESTVVYDEDTAYIMFYMGDWDGASWVNGIMPIIWEASQQDAAEHPDDPIPLAWPINSCLADRIPQMYNMLYETAGATDYFVTGDNGTGYLNPMFLEGEYIPEGLENYLDEWVAHNVAANERFDLDISGFLIEGTVSSSTETVRQAYSQITPYGVVSTNSYDSIENGDQTTPFPKMYNISNMRTDAQRQSAASSIASNIKFDGQFFAYRSVKASRADIRQTLEILERENPGIKYEVVDPYTFMNLYAQYAEASSNNTGAVYEAVERESEVAVDGSVSEGEWAKANKINVSTTAQEITDHGNIWGDIGGTDDLDVEFYLQWDNEYLYLLEIRTDDYLKAAYAMGTAPQYDIDASMLFLDMDGVRDGAKYFSGDFAVHYSFNSDNEPVIYLRKGSEDGSSKSHTLLAADAVEAVRTLTDTGYVCEIAIPWNLFVNGDFSFTPVRNATMGMTLLAIDHDESISGGRQIMWHGNGDTQDSWGVLKLAANCADEDNDHKCDACGEPMSECADADSDHICDTCGEPLNETNLPTGHSYDEGVVTTAPSCTSEGMRTYTCTCGHTYTEGIAATGHTEVEIPAVDATCTTDGATAGVKCSVCDTVITVPTVVLATGHSYDEGEVTTVPSCTSEGMRTYTCTCGYTYTEAISATGHTEEVASGKAANCTESGLTEGKNCSTCGETLVAQKEIPATGHSYTSVVTASTCTEAGYTTYTCTCGHSYVDDHVKAQGHTDGKVVEENRSIRNNGCYVDQVVYCSVCVEELSRETILVYLLGDVNSDGEVSVLDAMLVSQQIVGYIVADDINIEAANVNGDDEICVVDAMQIAQFVAEIIIGFGAEKK